MTVAELRALLETLPVRFDDTEVMVYGRGLHHIGSIELDRRRMAPFDEGWENVPEHRLQRYMRIRPSHPYWFEDPPEWRLSGWWPKEAAEIGLIGGEPK